MSIVLRKWEGNYLAIGLASQWTSNPRCSGKMLLIRICVLKLGTGSFVQHLYFMNKIPETLYDSILLLLKCYLTLAKRSSAHS